MKALKNKFYALILIPLFILCLASSYGAENSGTEEKPEQKQDKSGDFILGAHQTTIEEKNTAEISSKAQVYAVYGMDCPGCHGGLEKNVEKIPGVTNAVANWKDQQVTIFVENPQSVTAQQVAQAVENSNFTIGERIQ